jgi:hypothetical protein
MKNKKTKVEAGRATIRTLVHHRDGTVEVLGPKVLKGYLIVDRPDKRRKSA